MKRSIYLRTFVQLGFLGFLTWIGYRHQVLGGGPEGTPTVDALCPFGGLEGLWGFLNSGVWLRRLAPSSLVLLVVVGVMTLLFGRVFCGWICPLGTLGEWTSRAARKAGIRARELPSVVDKPLRWLKYVIGAAIIAWTWKLGTLVWRDYDPWVAWMHLSAFLTEVAEKPWSFVVLFGAVIGASLFVERFWCRYLCPLGALLAVGQKFAFIRIHRSDESCICCHRCGAVCPVGLDPEASGKVSSAECIACGRCAEACPVKETLFFGVGKRILSVTAVGVAAMVLFFGSYALARYWGVWQTYAAPPATLRGAAATEGIYGWMSVEQIAETLHLSPDEVIELGGLDPDIPKNVPVKEIEGVDDEAFRERLSEALETESQPGQGGAPNPDELRGSVTMAEIEQTYDIDGEELFREAGWPADGDRTVKLKDLAEEYGKEVSEIREALKKLLAR
jgi:polyferredoxin